MPDTTPTPRQTSEEELRAATVGEPTVLDGPVHLADDDPAWPAHYDAVAARIRAALGDRAILLEHVGSTSVPGLPAKPIIDVLLVVADSADEPTYVPPMEAAGFPLHIREPDWHQHRLFKNPAGPAANIHVFSTGSLEIDRMLAFRDHLRVDPADRDLYLRTKRDLAARTWRYVQHYAYAKSAVVEEILARARRSRPARQRGLNDDGG